MCSPQEINCFKCYKWFLKEKGKECEECGEISCPHCSTCLCNMNNETIRAVIAMIRTYENFIYKTLGTTQYDLSKHNRILEKLKDK